MPEDNYRHKGMRRSLVRTLEKKGIKDLRVLKAMYRMPRHYFFDNAFLEHAYQDKAFPIGEGQTISQPYTVAFQTELLNVRTGNKILEIGTGSGYQCCILLELGAKVYTIEYNKTLYEHACNFLPSIGYMASFVYGDGTKGLPTYAPYDGIIVTAGAPSIPDALIEQLKVGGRLVIPVGDSAHQKMIRIMKGPDNQLFKTEYDDFSFVPLLGKYGWK